MILTLTPNPALDVTYTVDDLRVHGEHRVREVTTAAGGKGVNVARVLAQLGNGAVCSGPLGGGAGEELRTLLAGAGERVRQAWTRIEGTTRRTLTVVDAGGATGLNEPGPTLSAEELLALRGDLTALLTGVPLVQVVTINGSLPPGMEPEDLADLVRTAREAGRPVLVDTSGPGLLAAAEAGATVLKPNAAEAMEVTGESTPEAAAAALSRLGVQYVVCSLGKDGILGLERTGPSADAGTDGTSRTDSGTAGTRAWRARLPQPLTGNPTGAGDSVVAVLAARLLLEGEDLPSTLVRAVAVSASAVTRPAAGEVDLELADRLAPTIEIEEIPCP